ncbi:SusC/RagA family TonB-linked outer membrane protein [Parapedobacter soli]|uniref:SusC/RagA family TonB-linked outer membrane protein n=1 Tax=Parapedobacter soli TaxID=416955 RepID=UPI0021C931F5|nr:TonB-dependent receptor [Parapedobacter soli]
MTRKTYYFLLMLCLVSITAVSAQETRQISGSVLDENGVPLQGVSVTVKGKDLGVATNIDGGFNLLVQLGDVLVFGMVGYETQEISYENQQRIDVVMAGRHTDLDEVVVIGFGTQKRANLTGAVSSIETGDLASRPFTSTSNALQGVAPGVTVTTPSGAPGSGGTIRVRGIGTLNNSNPLVLIDGVEGDMNSIDPNMIASINVLKDAASSAIYGSRAANGVILVTTKRASGNVLKVGYNAYTGFQTPTNLPDKVDAIDHMEMINMAHVNSGASPLFTQEFIDEYRQNMHVNPDEYPNTDWQKEVLKGSGVMHNHNLSVNGGGEKFRFLTSAGYLDQQGIIKASRFERYALRNNTDITFSEKLNMQFDVQLIKRNTTTPGSAGEVGADGLSAVFLQMNRIPAIQPGQYSNGLYGEGWNGNNPIAFANGDGGSMKEEHLNLLGRFVLNYKPVEWLNVELLAQPRYEELYSDNFNKAVQTYQLDGSPLFTRPERSTLTNQSSRALFGNYYGYLTANQNFGEHALKVLLGSSLETFYTRDFRAYREGFIFPQYRVLDAGLLDNREATGTASEWALQSFFGRFNYDFDSRYLFEVNARYDGSSRFAKGHKYGFFPSVSGGWRISAEDFMQGTSRTVNNLMLRASWGRLGNQNIGTYPFASTLNLGSYSLGGQIMPIAALNEMSNEQISWETSEMTNIGLDLMLFGNLTLTFDWYDKITSDILLELDIPMSIGLEAPTQNAGKVRNRGWDAGLGYKGKAGEFKYGVDVNVSDVKNTVLDLRGVSQTGLRVSREGYPINSIFALQADGYFQSDEEINSHVTQIGVLAPGDIRYVNQNNDDVINADDFVIIGSTIPRFTYSLNLNAEFKNFTFNAFAQGVGKADGYLHGRAIQPFFSGASAYEQHKDYWTPENRNATFPRLTWGDAGNNYQHSSFWMRSAAYLRLKNIQLGYNLPKTLLGRIKVEQARIYINGQNLFTVDRFWDGYDVETPVGTGTNYPVMKTYSLGIDFRF